MITEEWSLRPGEDRLVALIEAGAYGPTLASAAAARLTERAGQAGDVDELAAVLLAAVLCGIEELSDQVLASITGRIGAAPELGPLGRLLATVLSLWRHDRLLGAARSVPLGTAIRAGVARVLWLAEGVHGGAAPADPARLHALTATRDALVHAGSALDIDAGPALAAMARIAADPDAPPDLRGAAFGFGWSMAGAVDPERAVRGAARPETLGDWLAGLFALAREQVLHGEHRDGILAVLDGVVSDLAEHDFLVGLPALRLAFGYFPPREREIIAGHLLARRGSQASPRSLLRSGGDPLLLARSLELESYVQTLLAADGLIAAEPPAAEPPAPEPHSGVEPAADRAAADSRDGATG